MKEKINLTDLIKESSETNRRASNALLLVVRQMAKTANIISDTFGSDWPENQQ